MSFRSVMTQRAVLVTVVYAVLSGIWIAFSDQALGLVISDPVWLTRAQTAKGWLFVAVTAVLLYLVIRHADRVGERVVAPEVSESFRGSLRQRILLVILLAMLPVFGLTLYSGLEQRQRERVGVEADLWRCSRMVVARQERIWDSVKVLVTTLQEVPAVRQRDAVTCRELFNALLQHKPRWETLAVVSDSGRVLVQAGHYQIPQ